MAMDVESISGPGVGSWLIAHLREWGIATLTDVQVRAVKAGIADGRSMIVSAPTSSGKTMVSEIAVLNALRKGMRAIYLVSHKALADQKYLDFVERFGEKASSPIASVALNTGDREEGDIDAQLSIATYEKALGMVLSGQLKLSKALVVADELQILGEDGRGPEIETLCAVFRKENVEQFVALTATIENVKDLAGWMNCDLVESFHRDVPLHQEIWYSNEVYRTTFGQTEGTKIELGALPSGDLNKVVLKLLELDRGPVLVFTETRREASEYASSFAKSRPRVGQGIVLAEQLELFSEPTESSDSLKENAERRVAFHSADLSPQERQVIEEGFADSKFEVCFATSTLAAGVNFPFRSIVFPKLTYQWRSGERISRSDYRNMSGRAGRLGMHDEGYSVLLPKNKVELAHANDLASPVNDHLDSKFVSLSLRKTILTLVASNLANDEIGIMSFFENTLYWYQILERNPTKLLAIKSQSHEAIEWLIANGLLNESGGALSDTPLGKNTALSGLLPATAVQFAQMIVDMLPGLDSAFDDWIYGLIYAICSSEEFYGDTPSRYLPRPSRRSSDSVSFWAGMKLYRKLDRNDEELAQCAHSIALYADGVAERKIAYTTKVSSGAVHRLAIDVAWILEGLHKIACVPGLGCPQAISNRIAMLARQVRWGAPAEALDIMRIAERYGVPGFGRQRAMALITQGIKNIHDVLGTSKDRLIQVLRSERRAQALLDAASNSAGHEPSRLLHSHAKIAATIGLQRIVEACNKNLGVEYEKSMAELLRVESTWTVTALDDGVRQNVPDLLVVLGDSHVLIECKTCDRAPPLIKKEEAWAIMQKAADYDASMWRVTLGKPAFDETSKKKASASHDITLVEHGMFMEGLLRVHTGTLAPEQFLQWLSTPGVAEFERLGGTPTYTVEPG